MDEDKTYRVIASRHVTFDENKFLGGPGLGKIIEDEVSDDDTDSYMSEDHSENNLEITQLDEKSIQSENENESEHNQFSINESHLQTPQCNVSNDSNSNRSIGEEDSEVNSGRNQHENEDFGSHEDDKPRDDTPDTIDDTEDADLSSGSCRYPPRSRKPPGKWYVASTAQHNFNVNIKITTSNETALCEIRKSTPEEQALWQAAIDDEFK